jgi:nitrous oxide reductase
MKERSQGVRKGRRGFLRNMALLGGAAGAAAAAAGGAAIVSRPEPKEKAQEPAAATGYHETPHIRTYYEKAQL